MARDFAPPMASVTLTEPAWQLRLGALGLATLISAFFGGCARSTPNMPTPTSQAAPDNAAPDNAAPDNAAPDNAAPDNAAPDNAAPDNAASDNAAPTGRVVLEPSFEEQLAAVARGDAIAIRLTLAPVNPQQLGRLSSVADQLQELILDAGVVRDADLGALAPLRQLEHLRLRDSRLTDAGAAQLAAGELNQLRILNLPQAELTAAGIAHLSRLPRLSQLRLAGSQLDDRAVAALAALPELRSLHLIGPTLSDAALDSIAALPKLGSFYLDDCALSDAAWERLFIAKPSLHVHIDQFHHDRDPNRHDGP
jgi:hypothetical protein